MKPAMDAVKYLTERPLAASEMSRAVQKRTKPHMLLKAKRRQVEALLLSLVMDLILL